MNLKRSIFCAVFLSSFILLQSPAFAEMVSIRGENVNMRSGPSVCLEIGCRPSEKPAKMARMCRYWP